MTDSFFSAPVASQWSGISAPENSGATLFITPFLSVRKTISSEKGGSHLPLLRPAILAALVYSFVRAMTAISAVIFLVSARYDMATSYIIGRVENNDYGLAIAYSTALIFVMLFAVGMLQLAVGRTKIGRRSSNSGGH